MIFSESSWNNFLFHVLSTSWPHVQSILLWTQENLPNFSHLLTHLPQLQISEIFCSYIFTHLLLSGAGHFPGWVRFKPNPKANPTLLTRNHSHSKTQTFGSGQVSGGYIASKIFSLLHLLSKNKKKNGCCLLWLLFHFHQLCVSFASSFVLLHQQSSNSKCRSWIYCRPSSS